ncbi:histidinol-phosphatase HisJ [Shouchella shacheensis]|uniref:histidinol-phosphatase HisJ n=1 Tax=Shouchella shacheensis TaxID=1649580 RepID=UPI00073FC8EE|nr:histidinol-phosphatase HisJ [Shouchella shacheensis]
MLITIDSHVHTPYCPHGSPDRLADYCEQAIKQGIHTLSFTEHAPLPPSFSDPVPDADSAMKPNDLVCYLEDVAKVKKEYAEHLTVKLGLEVDYLIGIENETRAFLNEVGPLLDDSLLSVHFLETEEGFLCLDYSPEMFELLVKRLGSVEAVHKRYYQTVQASISANLGPHKPKRIGHMTLVRKFIQKFPTTASFHNETDLILQLVRNQGLELDYNGAGIQKAFCKETYPPREIAVQAARMNIPLVYGSDAHTAKGLLSGRDFLISI